MHQLIPADFFVIRTPRLAVERLLELPTDASGLDHALGKWLESPVAQEALYLSSPAFFGRLHEWRNKPRSDGGRKLAYSLLKYFTRMCTRPTPFGLFAGVTLGRLSDRHALVCGPGEDDSRVTRIDMSILCAMHEHVSDALPGVRLGYAPNQSIHRVHDSLHYIEPYFSKGERNYRLSSLVAEDHLLRILQLAEGGVSKAELVPSFREWYPEAEEAEVDAYIGQLIEASVLRKSLPLTVTGESPEKVLARSLASAGATQMSNSLSDCIAATARIDSGKVASPEAYEQARQHLNSIPLENRHVDVFQVDLYREFSECVLDAGALKPLVNTLQLLLPDKAAQQNHMKDFITRFKARFENQTVPLLRALDEEAGIPFGSESGYPSRLLAGLRFEADSAASDPANKTTPFQARVTEAWANNTSQHDSVLRLASSDFGARKEAADFSTLPYSFAAVVSLYHDEAGQFVIHYKNCIGPSGANLIGRFCHLNDELLDRVQDHLKAEEAHSPDAIFAEVLHIPHGRAGNVIARPHLREHEIVFFGDSDLPEEKQIGIRDLHVYVENGVVKLWSKRLGRQVVPRLSCAHNYSTRSLGIYKFLCALVSQGTGLPKFELPSELRKARFIPRIMLDNVILHEKQWVIAREEIQGLVSGDAWQSDAWATLAARYGLDRFVTHSFGDHTLTVDLFNTTSIMMLLNEVKAATDIVLRECLSACLKPAVLHHGPDGRALHLANELVVPMTNPGAAKERTAHGAHQLTGSGQVQRKFGPGSHWLSLKLYGAQSSVEAVLLDVVAPLAEKATASGLISRWFFIRYGDPDWHVRVRMYGEPASVCGIVLPRLEAALKPYLESGLLKQVESFTYEREIERYGGDAGILLAEELFFAESRFVVDALRSVSASGQDARWKFALLGCMELLEAFGYGIEESLFVVDRLRAGMGKEFNESSSLRSEIGKKYRALNVPELLAKRAEGAGGEAMAPYVAEVRRLGASFQRLAANGELACSVPDLLSSFLHMLNNRVFKADNRKHELVIYDFLRRFLLGQRARG